MNTDSDVLQTLTLPSDNFWTGPNSKHLQRTNYMLLELGFLSLISVSDKVEKIVGKG